jgi:hypothetical protein
MLRAGCISFAAFIGAMHLACAAGPPQVLTFGEALPAVRHELSVVDGRFGGAGATVLTDALAAARYVLIGEEHFTREVPVFTASVCDSMAPQLAAMAVEAGQSATEAVSASLNAAEGQAGFRALLAQYPDSIAFLNGREEHALLARCAAAVAPRRPALWGLDQEFIGAALRMFDLMLATGPGPQATAALETQAAAERVVEEKARASGDPSALWLLSASKAEVEQLRSLVDPEGNPRARALMAELAASRMIYLSQGVNGAESNRERALLMKRHLVAELARAGLRADQKVLFKFGGNHAAKGYSPLEQLDLGNQVAERADAEGAVSLHILVIAAGGTSGSFGGHGKPVRPEPIVPAADVNFTWPLPFIQARLPTAWTLFDLRRLRHLAVPDASVGAKRLIESYDLLVVIPEATAAELLPS